MKNSIQLIAAVALLAFVAVDANAQNEDVPRALPVAKEPAKAQPAETLPAKTLPAKNQPTMAKPIAGAVTSAVRPLSVTVELVDGKTKLIGTLTDTTTLDMKTSFGVVSVPLTEVAGFRFPSADDATTTLVMLNGDSITGATDVKLVTVETEWGLAQINGQSIQSILFVPSLTWGSSTGLNGKRWTLTEPKKTPAPASRDPRSGSQAQQPQRSLQSVGTPTIQSQPQFSPGFGN